MRYRALLPLLLLAACAKGHFAESQAALTGPLPPPAQVMVTDFAVRPDEVRLDRGVSAEIMRSSSGETPQVAQMEAAAAVQRALAETLVARLRVSGLPAERAAPQAVPPPRTLLVQGQILSVDEGNRTRRILIGLGAGKSSITADAQLSRPAPADISLEGGIEVVGLVQDLRQYHGILHGHATTFPMCGGPACAASPIRTTRPRYHSSISTHSIAATWSCWSLCTAPR
jgi:hypothetical protein